MVSIIKIISLALSLTTKIIERMNKKEMQEGAIAKMEVDKLKDAYATLEDVIKVRRMARRNFDKDDIKYYRE